MILLIAVVLSLLIALLRGGRLERLAEISFRYGWLALVALGMQILLTGRLLPDRLMPVRFRIALLLGSHLLLLLVVVANYRLPGMPLIGLGLALNLTVMLANGGWMPVTMEALEAAQLDHLVWETDAGARVMGWKNLVLSRGETRLWILSDVIVVSFLFRTLVSLGDIALALGVFILFQRTMKRQAVTQRPDG
ncbi:MAG: DUF5317 domain-containing protein [Anaerolineae bacterium]|nr:DUF5317 domain-containing protein [Anaerolineae bacterium]